MTTGKQSRRADLLAAYSRRAIYGVRSQRKRLATENPPFPHDLDFYANAAWQLREAGRQARDRIPLPAVSELLEALDAAIPRLQEYRDAMSHAVDDALDNAAWFGRFVIELRPGGNVDYIIDTRYSHHDALEEFFAALIEVLEPLCSESTLEWNEHARLV